MAESTTRSPRRTQGPSANVLEVAIAEQRRVYDELVSMKQNVNIKTLTLAGAGLAVLTYLYGSGDFFIPDEVYGKIFYAIGATLLVGAVSVLLYAVKPSGKWELPTETKQSLQGLSETDKRKYLEYVKDRYIYCYTENGRYYHSKQRLMNLSFYPLVFGAIILVVIKIFGGQ